MHLDVNGIINLVILILGGVIAHAVKTPKDHERAHLLTTLAESAAAVVVNVMPNAEWPKLLEAVIARLGAESTLPTKNVSKLENAATAALVRLGKTAPPAGP